MREKDVVYLGDLQRLVFVERRHATGVCITLLLMSFQIGLETAGSFVNPVDDACSILASDAVLLESTQVDVQDAICSFRRCEFTEMCCNSNYLA